MDAAVEGEKGEVSTLPSLQSLPPEPDGCLFLHEIRRCFCSRCRFGSKLIFRHKQFQLFAERTCVCVCVLPDKIYSFYLWIYSILPVKQVAVLLKWGADIITFGIKRR